MSPACFDDNIQTALNTGLTVVLDAKSYTTTSTLTIPAGGALVGAGSGLSTIVANHNQPSIVMGDGTTVRDLGITSSSYPSSAITDSANWQLYARSIELGNHGRVENVTIQNASGGIECHTVNDVTITNVTVSNVRERHGWGAAFHIVTSSNVVASGLYATDVDRYIEVEEGSSNSTFTNGTALRVYPVGYSGQPVDYATYSFVLDAHAHEGNGGPTGIHYTGFVLDDCLTPISAQRSTGTNLSDCPSDVSYTNVEIKSPRSGGAVVEINNARNVTLHGVSVTSGTYGDADLVRTEGSDTANVHLGLSISNGTYTKRAVNITAPGVTLDSSVIGDRSGALVFDVVQVTGSGDAVTNSTFGATTSQTLVHLTSTSSGCTVTGNTATTGTILDEGSGNTVSGNVIGP